MLLLGSNCWHAAPPHECRAKCGAVTHRWPETAGRDPAVSSSRDLSRCVYMSLLAVIYQHAVTASEHT